MMIDQKAIFWLFPQIPQTFRHISALPERMQKKATFKLRLRFIFQRRMHRPRTYTELTVNSEEPENGWDRNCEMSQMWAIVFQLFPIVSQIWAIVSQIWAIMSQMWENMLYRWAIVKHCAMSNLDMNQAPRIRNYWSFCCVTENPNHNLITAPCHICLSFRFDEKDNISEIRPRSMTLPGRKVFIARLKGRNIHASYTLHILSHHWRGLKSFKSFMRFRNRARGIMGRAYISYLNLIFHISYLIFRISFLISQTFIHYRNRARGIMGRAQRRCQ